MNECWIAEPNPPATWADDGLGTTCVAVVCRYDNAVLGYAVLYNAVLGTPCDPLFEF